MVQPTIKKLTKGRESIKGLNPKKQAKDQSRAAKRFPNTTETSKRVGSQSIHKKTGASLTSPNAREVNIRSSHLEKGNLGTMGRNMGRPDSSVQAKVNTNVSGKGINPNRPSSIKVTPTKVEGPGKSTGTGRGTVSNTGPSKKDPRVQRTTRNMKDMNRAFAKDTAKPAKPKAPARPGGLSMKPLVNTLASQGEPTSMTIKKLGVERFADRKGMVNIAKTHAARRAPEIAARAAGKIVGKAAARLIPGVGALLTASDSAAVGMATGRALRKATTRSASSGSDLSVVSNSMQSQQVREVAKKLKRK